MRGSSSLVRTRSQFRKVSSPKSEHRSEEDSRRQKVRTGLLGCFNCDTVCAQLAIALQFGRCRSFADYDQQVEMKRSKLFDLSKQNNKLVSKNFHAI